MPPRKSLTSQKGRKGGKGGKGESGRGGRGKGGKGGGTAASAAASQGSVYGQCETNHNILSQHQLQITEDLQLILTQEGFTDLLARAGASPAQAPFRPGHVHSCHGGPGVYRCGGNALWASVATGPVAPNANKMEELIAWQFSRPSKVFPETVVIGVLPSSGPKPNDVAARGNLVRLTPEEPHARLDHGRRQVHP